ncbi:MAG: thioredoxin domain-containing protein [Alphaproteobacteria bacterium]|nr:thioredoxin domain-containing protein [Alphaproteobacteria bacterium]
MISKYLLVGFIVALVFANNVSATEMQLEQENNTIDVSLKSDLKPSELRIYGNQNNLTSIYVFSSLSCPHCSVFHKELMPDIIKQFIQTDKAKLVYVEMPYDAKAMTGTMYARCVQPHNYNAYMAKMFHNQEVWMNAEKPRRMMLDYALSLGEDVESLEQCVSNWSLKKQVTEQRNNLSELYLVRSLPTVVVVKNHTPKKFLGTDKQIILQEINRILESR